MPDIEDSDPSLLPWAASVWAGILFWDGGFSDCDHWYAMGPDYPYSANLEATAQLAMRFTVKGDGAVIAAEAGGDGTTGSSLAFSVFDETDGTMLFSFASQGGGSSFQASDLYLVDGHTYRLLALCDIIGTSTTYKCFDWSNSTFGIRVPECSALLLFVAGLFLLISTRDRKDGTLP